MITTPYYVKKIYESDFETVTDDLIEIKLNAIESAIRAYTNNNFQVRACRAKCITKGKTVITYDVVTMFRVGDTVQISKSKYNDGLYVIQEITGNVITLDKELIDQDVCLATKVQYPLDIVEGAINVLRWDMFDRDKVGKASETISRHSVSYQQYDGTNTINGFPAMLFGFCTPYMRART